MLIIKHIPNTITSMNLLSGVIGVIFALNGDLITAFPLMIAAACFDFCDGLAARLLGAYSDIGKELDSLADMVSFGVLPSVMLYKTMTMSGISGWITYLTLLLAVFSALRLAKFNIDERQHASFIGLPTPAAAMICGSLTYYAAAVPDSLVADICSGIFVLPALAVILSALLVSEMPMFAMKFGKDIKADPLTRMERTGFLSGVLCLTAVTAILGTNWSLAVLLSFLYYIILNAIFSCFAKK
jgi:CDP-diacylglycerol---serine O-phosphatidyltransferase